MSKLLHSRQSASIGQNGVSPQRRFPVESGETVNTVTISGETVQFYYYSSTGVLTQDAGQAAGTIVVAKLKNKKIANALADGVGNFGDTSFSFGTGTILTQFKPFRGLLAEDAELTSELALQGSKNRAIAVTEGFQNGWYTIDHEHGVIYGKKATTGTSDTGSYKVSVPVSTLSTTSMQQMGTEDVAGADTYTTLITPTAAATNFVFSLKGTNDAIVSFDGGVTEGITIPAPSSGVLERLTIPAGVAIQAKNKTAGSNYAYFNSSVY